MQTSDNHPYPNIMYIVEGGMLLHTIKWAKGSTFEEICFSYYTWITKYEKVMVVFDGYQPSTLVQKICVTAKERKIVAVTLYYFLPNHAFLRQSRKKALVGLLNLIGFYFSMK